MRRDPKEIIKKELNKNGRISSKTLADRSGISRQAAHKQLAILVRLKKLTRIGRTKSSYYTPYSAKVEKEMKTKPAHLTLKNKGLQEDLVFDQLEIDSDIIKLLPHNPKGIFKYAFTEMLNNAIEHSRSKRVKINVFEQEINMICFEIIDSGIGIFNNIREKNKLKDDLEALQELLKGKKTTAPAKHSGEGIFFTSKIADKFNIKSSKLRLIIDNQNEDIIIEEVPNQKGTKVFFQIKKNSKKDLGALFGEYTNENFKFSKSKVTVNLYTSGENYVSRSQARRILFDMEKFQTITLDFDKIKGIGQSFADEVFRVFQAEHPEINLVPTNTCDAVLFMINRAKAQGLQ